MRFGGFKALLYYLQGVNEILPTYCYILPTYCYIFHPTLLIFGTEDVQTFYIVTVSSVIIDTVKAMLRVVNEFLLLLNIFLDRLG
jgi:hypothetical protein